MAAQARRERLLQSLTEFSRTLLVTDDVDIVLGDLATRLNELLEIAGTGIGLERDGSLEAVGALPAELMALERAQMAQDSGPCIDAHRSGEVTVCDDLREETRWPGYRVAAEKAGVLAVVGVPLRLQAPVFGAMNLYSIVARRWSEEDLRIAGVLANMATGYLVSSELRQQEELSRQLQRALDSRVVIEQAKGIVAESRETGVEEAFKLIRDHARSNNRGVRAVAAAVVDEGLRP